MLDFKKVLGEIDAVRNTIILTFVFLDSAFVFLVAYLTLTLFNFYPILSFVPALFYSAVKTDSKATLMKEPLKFDVFQKNTILLLRFKSSISFQWNLI